MDSLLVTKDELAALVERVLTALKKNETGASVIALHGDLGAGKTTFVQALGQTLGVTEAITSPTFTIMKGYETANTEFTTLIHMDAYRLESEAELEPLRFADILALPRTLVCIEWAEKIKQALPEHMLNLTFNVVDETTRSVHIS